MTVEELLDWAVEHEDVDLQALIMFLVYEKKTLQLSDNSDKIKFYTQDKFKVRMNDFLNDYKKKLNMQYKANVYSIITQTPEKYTFYLAARSEKEAREWTFKHRYKVESITPMPLDMKMVWVDKQGNEIYTTIKKLRDQVKEIPSFIGGFD